MLAERQNKRGSYIVIDGKQRLLSIRRFGVEDQEEFERLTLSGLKNKSDLNGNTWIDLKDNPGYQEDIVAYENQTIRTVVVRNWPNESFLYLVFLRLNTGSLPLSSQELRQTLHPGPFTDFVDKYSSDSASIKKALGLRAPNFRIRDIEVLIRFVAFAESLHKYSGNVKDFLDDTAKLYNDDRDFRESALIDLAQKCDDVIEGTIIIFGNDAFRRWGELEGFVGRFNRAVFDIMTFYFRNSNLGDLVADRKAEMKEAFKNLCATDELFTEIFHTTSKSVQATFRRLNKWGNTLRTVSEAEVDIPKNPPTCRRG